ncbi:hypothetical protein Vadar_001685 [Vaccinium darrowii]|uniref:Uncharacterized protein n=1 Tax=Vaccinium darrowii TaxID=229202 RepID=A0ACB7ZGU2_9ERIC|nr:hypothetical protein Vadar_001685 [Vaccinium darrowii]
MLNTEICTCSHGWLVLFEFESNECFLLNPVSMEKIMLPKLPPAFSFSTCILSAPPTDPECIVIFESTENPSVIFLRLGESVWTEQYLGSDGGSFRGAAMCGGRIYGLALGGTLMTAKVVGSNLVVTQVGAEELPNNTIPETFHFSYQIVESNGELFGVVKYYKGTTDRIRLIEVYKMEFSRLRTENPSSAWRKRVDRTILEIDRGKIQASCRVRREDLRACSRRNSSDGKELKLHDSQIWHWKIAGFDLQRRCGKSPASFPKEVRDLADGSEMTPVVAVAKREVSWCSGCRRKVG